MKRTLFLHIGSHRTGTTSIQSFLRSHFEDLLNHGTFLPFQSGRHVHLMNAIFNGAVSIDEVVSDLNQRADSKPTEVRQIILSDEDVCMRPDLSALKAFRDHFDVKVIFSLRRQDLWLESWYFQNVKWQWNPELSHCTFDEFLTRRQDFHWIYYDAFVRHLEKLFGQENVILNVFEKQQMPGGPVATFLREIGLDAMLGDETRLPHINSSMSAAMVEFARHLPLDEFEDDEREILRRALDRVDLKYLKHDGKQSERLMPPEQRRAILANYADGNAALAQRYFGRDKLFLDPLPPEDMPLAKLEIPSSSQDLIKNFVAPMLRELVDSGVINAETTAKSKK